MTYDEFAGEVARVGTVLEELKATTGDRAADHRIVDRALEALGASVDELLAAREELLIHEAHLAGARALGTADRDRLEAMLRAAPVRLLSTGPGGIVGEVSDAGCALFGAAEGQLEGLPLATLARATDRGDVVRFVCHLGHAGAGGDHELCATWQRRDGGEPFRATLRGEPVGDDVRWTLVNLEASDDDDRATAASARTRCKHQLLGGLTCSLREPLTSVTIAAQVLQRYGDTLSSEWRAWALDVIERRLGQLRRTLRALLDASEAARGTLALDERDVDLAAELRACIGERAERSSVVCVMPACPVVVSVDPGRLRQSLGALIDVALVTSPRGAVRTSVRTRGGAAVVSIVTHRDDSGPGRYESAAPEVALARLIIERHGGRVELTDGSWSVALPLAEPRHTAWTA